MSNQTLLEQLVECDYFTLDNQKYRYIRCDNQIVTMVADYDYIEYISEEDDGLECTQTLQQLFKNRTFAVYKATKMPTAKELGGKLIVSIDISIDIEVKATVSNEDIKNAIRRGLAVGLDQPPHYICDPSKLDIQIINIESN